MTELLDDALKAFLDDRRGLPEDFWGLSFGDVLDVLDSIRRNAENERELRTVEAKAQAVMLQNAAIQNADAISLMFSRYPRKLHTLDEYYPKLFQDDEEAEAERQEREFLAFCDEINATRRARRALAGTEKGGVTDGAV